MAVDIWGSVNQDPLSITSAAGSQTGPAVADNEGLEFGVAWIDGLTIKLSFYDEQGILNPVLPGATVTDGAGVDVADVHMSAGGAGLGYGILWQESAGAGQPNYIVLRYYNGVTGGLLGGEITVSTNVLVNQHDAAISHYFKEDANGRPTVDGFDVAWVEGAGGAHSAGDLYLQRFAVPLDAAKDPIGPPAPVGVDGATSGNNGQILVANNARDPSVAGLINGGNETVVTWIDNGQRINLRIYNDNGSVNTNATGAAANNLNTAAAPMVAGSQQHVIGLAGGGFVVAWVATSGSNNFIAGRVFTPGAAAGTFAAGVVQVLDTLDGASNTIADFSLAALPDTGGFSLTWNALDDPDGVGPIAATQAIHTRAFSAAGVAQELVAAVFHAPGDANSVASAGLIGDRYIVVYQDNSTPGDAANIAAQIFDTRLDPLGNPIVQNGAGVTMIGDPEFETRGRVDPDVLVGTIGQDLIDGRQADDILDGALGDDTIVAGGGNDSIDGGGGSDTVTFTGRYTQDGDSSNDDYAITYEGNGVFTVVDLRADADGADILREIEFFQFLGGGNTLTAADLLGEAPNVTPTAWGWTNADADTAPNSGGTPDVDGFVVNHAAASLAGIQTNPFVADSVGEFVGVVWETATAPGADTHIRGQFYDVIGNFDEFIPNAIDISDGAGIETNPAIVSGGANSGWGAAWEQRDDAGDVSRELRTNFVGPGQLTSVESSVFVEGASVDQHDAALSGSFLDRTFASPVGGSVLPTGMSDGYNVAWVSTHLDGADGALPEGYGRIMLQRFEVPLDALGNPSAPVAGGVDGISGLSNVYGTGDDAVWVGDEDANGLGGAFGRNPSTAGLHTFETGIAWVAQDGAGGEKVVFRAYDDLGQVIDFPGGDNISGAFPVAAGTNAHIVSAGAVNFAIAWITADATSPSGYSVMGTMLSSAGNGLNGSGFGFGAPAAPFVLLQLPVGFNPSTADFQLTGISGEDSADVIIAWNMDSVAGGADMMAQHIRVALDPITGIALSMSPEGDAIVVNAETAGDHDTGGIAGLLGDRFIAIYHDANTTYTDGSDIVARIIDTRDAANPAPIIGDLVRPDGSVQARRDVLVGTNGDDDIRGDISTSDGLTDYIYAGMGNDTIQGGPGVRGAAGIPEIIDGGEGVDTAVYTGRLQDYSITINGDGSYEVIDLRPDGAGTLVNDGIDNLYSIENIRFLDLGNNGADAQTIAFGFPGAAPPLDPSFDGTPVAWSLDDLSVYKEITVDADPTPADAIDQRAGIAVTNLQDGAGLAWTVSGNQVWAISYDTTGKPDPVLLGANTQLTSGVFSSNTVSGIDIAMTGGLGMATVWESSNAGDSSIHLAFASTNTHVVLDPAGGVPGPGLPGGELIVVGSDGDGVAIDPIIQGYEIVNIDNDTLEVGFHVGYVVQDGGLDSGAGDAYGALMIARYEIPVYDILVDGAGLPILDVNGQGQLATDAFGNLIPSIAATFGVGSETAPVSIGLDGLRGTADDNAAIVVTDAGLFAASDPLVGSDAAHAAIQGRNLSIGSLHDGQLVVSYIGTDEQVHVRIYLPSIDETADREQTAGNLASDIVATGVTTYSELTLPFVTTLGGVATGQAAYTAAQLNGSFGVFWGADDGAGGVDIQGVIYSGAGSNWSPSPVVTFIAGLPADVAFQVASTGVTPGGLEDGFFVTWQSAAGLSGQRFDMAGAPVGVQVVVGDPTTGIPGAHSTAGIDDGRMIVGYVDGNNVSAQYLDNRQSGVMLIGPRTGAPADVIAGTVGDDGIDGRALDDQLFGGLGDDLITMGSGADQGFGGAGDDTVIGGTGQDQLLGEDGDDVLWGGLSGPADPQVDGDLQTGLAAAGVSAALIATDPGADIVSGGAGVDTISFQGEFGAFNINLTTGIVTSDRDNNGSFILEDVIGQIDAQNATFNFTNDVENATGGIGNDTLIGSAGDNVLAGGGGDNVFDGGAGNDTVVIEGGFNTYTFQRAGGTLFISDVLDTQTIANAEYLQFEDRRVNVADLFAVLADGATASGTALIVPDGNHGPTAADDAAAVLQGHTVVIKALANDIDVDGGQALTIASVDGQSLLAGPAVVTGGVVTLLSNGALAFAADAAFSGVTSFGYTISDGMGGTAAANIAVNVASLVAEPGVNNGPASLLIAGAAAEHQTLAANLGADPDGAGNAPAFQWFRDGVAIFDATLSAYALTTDDIGHALTVQASYTDAEGWVELVASPATATVVAVDDGQASVAIAGVAAEHQTLSATVGADPDGAGTPAAFQWLRDGAAIVGATSADYTLVSADVGHAIRVQALYTDGQGFSQGPVSAATTSVVGVNDGQAAVALAGTAVEHQTLTATVGADPDGGNGTLSYQWLRDGVAIAGAIAASYTLGHADVGAAISARVSYTDGEGNTESVTSEASALVTGVDDGNAAISIFGVSTVGQTLSFTFGGDPDGDGAPAIQWLRNGSPTGQTGATYALTAADVGAIISVSASYIDDEGFAELVASAGTAPVATQGGLTITGTNAGDTLNGGAAGDTINALGGNDTATGNGGADIVNGGGGNDTVRATVNDGDDLYDGGTGTDTYNLSATGAGATVNLVLGTSSSAETGIDTLVNFENVTGSTGADAITGNALNNVLNGGAGDDTLNAGTAGNDTLNGGQGDDTFIIDHVGVNVTEGVGQGIDTVLTTLATFTLSNNVDNLIYTGAGNFSGSGNGLANVITGGAGADVLNGNGGADTLIGGFGADTLSGGAGADRLDGGGGNDTLTGGNGNDIFVFTPDFGADRIASFDANPGGGGQDLIDISALGVTAVDFASRVVVTDLGNDTLVTIDGISTITLSGVNGTGTNVITQADFILGGP